MRFHIPSIPHTVTSKSHSACAFTQNIVNFCAMMHRRGHEVVHYGHEDSRVECTELVSVVSRDIYDRLYGSLYDVRTRQYTILPNESELYTLIRNNTIEEIKKRKRPTDFLLLFGGLWHYEIAQELSDMLIVEPAIGYPTAFSRFRVYPSYAELHYNCEEQNAQMPFYHIVIPHYFDIGDFCMRPKEDYVLFIARLNFDKGITLAIDLTARLGLKLKIAGQGSLEALGYNEIPEHVDFVGYVDVQQRKELMSKARATLMLTLYMEPFGCVAIESLLSGTPIITNDWGGPGENNLHGITGYKCRTFEQFLWALKNIDRIDPRKCREWAVKNFSFDAIAPMYEEYFSSLNNLRNPEGWYTLNPDRTDLDFFKKHYPCT